MLLTIVIINLSGVHYMTKEEEEIYTRERTKAVNHGMDDIAVDAANKAWIESVM